MPLQPLLDFDKSRSAAPWWLSIMVLLTWSASGQAHDHLLWPDAFQLQENTPVTIDYRVGHAGEFAAWPHGLKQVASLRNYAPGATQNLLAFNTEASATATLRGTGTHLVVMESYRSHSTLAGKKFNDYLDNQGLTAIASHREKTATQDEPGRERYSRRAKTLIQVGANFTDQVTRPVGLTLEITPLQNPYQLADGEPLTLEVRYNGKPLAGATVSMEAMSLSIMPATSALTDADGLVRFPLTKRGSWKINTVWGVPQKSDTAEYYTVFSSLTFGF